MPNIESTTNFNHKPLGGGRIASDALRATHSLADDFAGLEEGVDHYGLLLLVKRTGKLAGFTPRMIQLLDYYVAYTRDIDWEEGSRPIVYQSLSRTALDLGVSERQVQKLEAALFEAGAITWNDSGNHKRFGRRCTDTHRIVYAYGVDLTPMAYLRAELGAKLDAKRRHDEAWLAAKRAISELRREFRGLAAEWAERCGHSPVALFIARYDAIAIQIRTHLTLDRLETLLAAHRVLVDELRDAMGVTTADADQGVQRVRITEETSNGSSTNERTFAHYNYTNQSTKVPCSPGGEASRGSVADGPAPQPETLRPSEQTAMEHVTLSMALGAVSEGMAVHLPTDPGCTTSSKPPIGGDATLASPKPPGVRRAGSSDGMERRSHY